MSSINCKKCKEKIPTYSRSCPECGIKNPGLTFGGMFGSIFIFSALIVTVSTCATLDHNSPSTPVIQVSAECKSDLSCLAEYHRFDAGGVCSRRIEKLANYNYEWTDGITSPKFGYYRWLDKAQGAITYVGDELKFQNGFSAWQNVTYECDFNTLTNSVISVRAKAGRL